MCRQSGKEPTPEDRDRLAAEFRAIDVEGYGMISEQQVAAFDEAAKHKARSSASSSSSSSSSSAAAGTGSENSFGKGTWSDAAGRKLIDPAADTGNDSDGGGGYGKAAERTLDLEAFIAFRWKTTRKPSMFLVHGALVLVQVIFGIGSVVGKLGVSKFNPVLFALIREVCAGPLLVVMALFTEGCLIKFCHRSSWRFVAGGVFLFANQLCFIVGEKLSSAVIGSAWQPSQAIFTVVLTIILCMEKPTVLKIVGILVACGGAVFMVMWGADVNTDGDVNDVLGNILFAVNCLGTSLYVIVTKPLLKQYPPLSVTGFCYICASIFMAVAAVAINLTPSAIQLICPPPANASFSNATLYPCGDSNCTCSAWGVPTDAVLPLLYWIVFNSAVAYFLMTFGNAHADASKVLAYTALQPLTSALLSVILLLIVPTLDLTMPGISALGGIGIVLGLVCIIWDDHLQKKKALATV